MFKGDYNLGSIFKKYDYDQEKFKSPQETYDDTFKLLNEKFPEKNFKLNLIETQDFYVYEFTDGSLLAKGKGYTKEQSMASAIMEYVERLAWLNFDYENYYGYKFESYNEIIQDSDFDLSYLKEFYDHLLNREKDLNLKFIDELFNAKCQWIKGKSLLENDEKYYPLSLNNLGQTSNGLASGNVKEEAILQAICELIERHNLNYFMTHFTNLQLNIVNIKTITSSIILDLYSKLQNKNIDLYIVDISLDIEVPTFIAVGIDKRKETNDFGYIGYGYGTQANPEKAIIRAITEYVQMNELHDEYDSNEDYLDFRKYLNINSQYTLDLDFLSKLDNSNLIDFVNLSNFADKDFLVEINNILELFRKKKYDLVLIDKTMKNVGIPVYRVWSPQLLPFIKFESSLNNFYIFLINIFYQSGNEELCRDFLSEYYDETLFNDNDPQTALYFQANPYITKKMLKKYYPPETISMANIVSDTYLKYLRKGNLK